LYKLIILLLICPVLHSEELDKILWGDSQLTSPLNFDFISSEFKNYKENNLSGIYSINSSPIGLGFEVSIGQHTVDLALERGRDSLDDFRERFFALEER